MHLIVFCDGTWNTPDQMEDGLPAATNVVKLYHALAPADAEGASQLSYYHPGVGTEGGWWDRIAGGGMGEGLDKNIMSAYNWLARHYRPGARIWLFGFSRGAYTVRSLGGMIARCGLLDPGQMSDAAIWSAIHALFATYREDPEKAEPVIATGARPFHGVAPGQPCAQTVPIHCIGVWDTVGALGVPDDMALLNLLDDPARHGFHDTRLSPIVAHARHALAIDEHRRSFTPTLWTGVEDRPSVRQIWFPGVHADVGGGYGRCALSDGALHWMMEETAALGLSFRDTLDDQICPDPRGQLHDSVSGVFKALKTLPRAVPDFAAASPALHPSALARHRNPPLAQGGYWKTRRLAAGEHATVDVFAQERWNRTGLYLEAGATYRLVAEGEWMDGGITCPPGGTRDGSFQLGEAVQMASSVLGRFEGLYKRLTGNGQADIPFTKRVEEADWFALIGTIANGELPDAAARGGAGAALHETFVIGAGADVTPLRSGYFYAYANDAWATYGNNCGSVRLSVERLEG
ncbi:DUF2235 domain-containing protein [Pseudooceanicola sp. CBS1P-1]|uniref:DUF2235 domain-containing protein n=1 Tax=Pseudooceanicola albus TaxID=2692189 RepID=A0A6L7G8S2_9RHOB|nr:MULTISPECIES: DUF2235 domain-containing protein [Pseudooceanicola]MBT9386320.1 DUF2235 domain-containing protein [Pseudooceanicola endophyticus]MXN20369.1 DUF2235 domain-containing protein [Pseudooceanicola albus]